MMATNRASMSDPFIPTTPAATRRAPGAASADSDLPRRTAMVIGGFVVALVSLLIASIAIAQVWLAPTAAPGAASAPTLQSWETVAMIVFGGLGFAAGAALAGIGMGRWTSPRPPESEADYTGPGVIGDTAEPPRVV
jgi:hypothetical protein